jgi:hypothetical protein
MKMLATIVEFDALRMEVGEKTDFGEFKLEKSHLSDVEAELKRTRK